MLRPLQTKLALGLCGLALLLALPILDFGAISAKSQVARFAAGWTAPADFDWQAMAFDFGPAGRRRLEQILRSGTPDQRRLARAALATTDRHQVEEQVRKADSAMTLGSRLRIVPEGAALPIGLRESIAATRYCRVGPCVVTVVDERRAVIAGPLIKDDNVETALLMPDAKGIWQQEIDSRFTAKPPFRPDVSRVPVELRTVERRQLHIDGKPVGEPFE